MLVDLMTGKPITSVPYASEYKRLLAQLSPQEISEIKTELNNRIDSDEIHTAGWMPGADWSGTPFQVIFEKAAKHNPELAAKCFGLVVWEIFMGRPEKWSSGKFEKNGEPIGSRTYFRIHP